MTRTVKIISGIVSILILIMLFMLGPAEAFLLSISFSESSPTVGDMINIMLSAEVEEGEIIPIDSFIFELKGKKDVICKFLPNGTVIEGCEGIVVTHISSPPFEFGYGYNGFIEGILSYDLVLDTSIFPIGKYDTRFIAIIEAEEIEISGNKIMINAPVKGVCSVRAENGLLKFNSKEFMNNRINFNVPLKKAVNGQGFLMSRNGKERFLYKFNIDGILENNEQNMTLDTLGYYRINNDGRINSNATVRLDKLNKKVYVIDNNFNSSMMDVNFIKGC